VNIGAYGLLRIGAGVFPAAIEEARWLLLGLGAAATLYGAVLALRRRVPAELAAYLAIAHAGHVMLGIGIGGALGVAAVLLAVAAGSIDKTMMFLALDLAGRVRRWTGFVTALGLAGLPLTLGFVAKVQLFRAGLSERGGWMVVTALLVATPITIAAAMRYWRFVAAESSPPARSRRWVPYALPAASVALGLVPEPLAVLVRRVGAGLLEGEP
jgi:multicomponent Na+:H+ antiporter subunit D